MKYELCIACDHCDPSKTNDRQQVFCEINPPYVDPFNGCDEFENKLLDEYFKQKYCAKMSEKEVMKALQICADNKPIEGKEYTYCGIPLQLLFKEILAFVNRQQAEIETLTARIGIYKTCNARKDEAIHNLESEVARLQNILLRFMDEVAKWENKHGLDVSELPLIPICDEMRSIIDHHRAEAIKEFAERLKKKTHNCFMGKDKAVTVDNINNLLNELVGDSNECKN